MAESDRDRDRWVVVGRVLERLARRLDAVEAVIGQLTVDLLTHLDTHTDTDLDADADAEGDGGVGGPGGVRSWLQAAGEAEDVARVEADLVGLCGWLGRVWLRFDDAELPSCWMWHPGVVEELWWCWHTWMAAYTGKSADWRWVAAWHHYDRPGVVRRVHAATRACDLSRHIDVSDGPVVPLDEAAGQLARAWAAHLRGGGWPPQPTAEQLAEAEALDTALPTHRSRDRRRQLP